MHDYLKGAYEALAWVKQIVKTEHGCSKVLKQVESAIDDINEGVAIDFRKRLKHS